MCVPSGPASRSSQQFVYIKHKSSTYSPSPLESATKPIERQSITEHSAGTGGKWQPSKPLSQIALFHSAVATDDDASAAPPLSNESLMYGSLRRTLLYSDGYCCCCCCCWTLVEALLLATYCHTGSYWHPRHHT